MNPNDLKIQIPLFDNTSKDELSSQESEYEVMEDFVTLDFADGEFSPTSYNIDFNQATFEFDDVYDATEGAKKELEEINLRSEHTEVQKAYEEYQKVLEKYKFWHKVTK